jgi:hypothetical protein
MPIDVDLKRLEQLKRDRAELEAEILQLLKRVPGPVANKFLPPLSRTLAILATLVDLAESNLEGKINGKDR